VNKGHVLSKSDIIRSKGASLDRSSTTSHSNSSSSSSSGSTTTTTTTTARLGPVTDGVHPALGLERPVWEE
jgi:hypothetical protein